jgi:hypothetical protein
MQNPACCNFYVRGGKSGLPEKHDTHYVHKGPGACLSSYVISGLRRSRIAVLALLGLYTASFLFVNQRFGTACRYLHQGVSPPREDPVLMLLKEQPCIRICFPDVTRAPYASVNWRRIATGATPFTRNSNFTACF